MSSLLLLLSLFQVSSAANVGSWGPSITAPLSPAGAYVMPEDGRVLMWASGDPLRFGLNGEYKQTYAAMFDPKVGSVTQELITGGHSDLFCPGVSVGFDGQVVIAGGSSSKNTTIHNLMAGDNNFIIGPQMKIARGYQSQVTLSDGRHFAIGGSWSGGHGGKNGEVLDLSTNAWSKLSGCTVQQMLTADTRGIFRQDNHGWLFAWKNASVFQAGPSKAMNWYQTTGSGSVKAAGQRDTTDAMCGTATMYDAANGKILTAGGSPLYEASLATSNSQILTLSTTNTSPQVQKASSLKYARTMHNSVALPDGTVLTIGGQSWAHLFTDSNATTIPELWSPATNTHTSLADQGIPRTYHSWALLLQDATVVSGGGGLCRDDLCTTAAEQHKDVQVFTPPYLLQADGKTAATRPVIASAPGTLQLGQKFNVSLAGNATTPDFSLVRLGSSTHTVNTDQRRLPVASERVGGANATFAITLPGDPGVVVPGYWFLFALDGGVPSVAKIVKVKA